MSVLLISAIKKKRRGYTLLETMISIVIMSFAMVGLSRAAIVELNTNSQIDAQYSMVAVDAFLSDIYHSFHSCTSMDLVEAPSGSKTLSFGNRDGGITIYSFDSTDNACYRNGVRQFSASSLDITKTSSSLEVIVTLPGDRMFDICIYK